MSKEYLPDKEKRILLSALSHEMRLVKDNNLTELIPVVKSLDYKFMYDRLFKQIEDKAYLQGIANERERISEELEEKLSEKKYQHDGEDYYVGISEALEIVRGGENE